MAVYVDKLFNTTGLRSSKWRHNQACHMWADDVEELHYMARRIGLKDSWFQAHPRLPHYDLTPNKRASAIAAGAVEGNLQEHFRKLRERERA